MIRVTVWNEFRHEQEMPEVKAIYPNGIHAAIAEFLSKNEDMTPAPPRWTSRSTA